MTQQGAFQSLKEKTLMISKFRDKCLQSKCKVGKYISSEMILFGCTVGNIPPILHVRVHLLRKLLPCIWKQLNIFWDPAELWQNYSIDKQSYWLSVQLKCYTETFTIAKEKPFSFAPNQSQGCLCYIFVTHLPIHLDFLVWSPCEIWIQKWAVTVCFQWNYDSPAPDRTMLTQ